MPDRPERPRATMAQRRSRETRERIVAAARELFRDRGFDETTINDLCAAAEITPGTFYFYFARKEDLLVEAAMGTADRTWQEWEALAPTAATTAEIVDALLTNVARRSARTSKPLLARTVAEMLSGIDRRPLGRPGGHDFFATFEALTARAKTRGELPATTDPGELARMCTIVTMQALIQWATELEEDLAGVLKRRAGFILRGAGLTPH